MVSRRRLLGLGAVALAATGGCTADRRRSSPASSTGSPSGRPSPDGVGDGERTTPGDVPEWTPARTMALDGRDALGLDAADGLLYATLGRDGGPSAVAAVDPSGWSIRWETEAEGEAVSGSHASGAGIARGQWGVTLAADAVYAVAGRVEDRRWTAVHALDRASGERRWSVRRERKLAVAGTVDDLVVAAGTEFFPPPGETAHSHRTPEEPLSTVVYGIDAANGDVRWRREFAGVRDVAVGVEGVYVAVGNRLVGLDPDGSDRFTYDRGPATAVEATGGGVAYLTGEDGGATLHGVAPDGSGDWRYRAPVGELLSGGDRVYAGGDAVVAVASDGTVDWRDDDHGQWLLLDPDRDSLYVRSGERADAATAYDVGGTERFTFDPPSTNAWPEAATRDALAVSAITESGSDDPFLTVYAVTADGEATAALGVDTVFDAVGLDGTVYLGDGDANLLALDP